MSDTVRVRVYRPNLPVTSQKPDRIPLAEMDKLPGVDSITFETGNGWETIRRGHSFVSRMGGRLVVKLWYNAGKPIVFYYENGDLYVQNALYFWKDAWMEAFQTGASWAAGSAIIATIQVEFCLGVMAGAGGSVASWALTATNILHLISEIDIVFLMKMIPKALQARRILKAYAPRLYSAVFSAFLDRLLGNIVEAMAKEAVAQLAGRVFGRLGRLEPGKILAALKDIALYFAAFLSVRILKASALAGEALVRDLIEGLRAYGSSISPADAEAIVGELIRNGQQIKEAFDLLSDSPGSSVPTPTHSRERIWPGTRG